MNLLGWNPLVAFEIFVTRPGSQFALSACGGIPWSDFSNHPSWIANGDDIGGYVLGDNRASANHAVVTDRYTRADDYSSAEPDVISQNDGFRRFELVSTKLRVDRVSRGQELYVGADLTVVADGDRHDVQGGEVEVDEDAVPDKNVVTVIDEQGWSHNRPLADAAKEFLQDQPGG